MPVRKPALDVTSHEDGSVTLMLQFWNCHYAENVANARRERGLTGGQDGYRKSSGSHLSSMDVDHRSVCSEIALALYLNVWWDGNLDQFWMPDVGPFEVRSRHDPTRRDLRLSPGDKGDHIYVLAWVEDLPRITLRGWEYGNIVMRQDLQKGDDRPENKGVWFYPHQKLRAMEELRALRWPPYLTPRDEVAVNTLYRQHHEQLQLLEVTR